MVIRRLVVIRRRFSQWTAVPKQPGKFDGRQQVMHDFARAAAGRHQHFFYILLRESLGPIERVRKYEDPLAEALGEMGEVTGGGSQMAKGKSIAFCGIDLVVNDRDRGLQVIRKCRRACGARDDTVIEEYIPAFNELSL